MGGMMERVLGDGSPGEVMRGVMEGVLGDGSPGEVMGSVVGDGSPAEVMGGVMEGVVGDGSACEVMGGVIGSVVLVSSLEWVPDGRMGLEWVPDGRTGLEWVPDGRMGLEWVPDGRMGLEDGSALGLITKEMLSSTALTELLRGVAVVWPVNKEEEEVGEVVGAVVGGVVEEVKSDTLCEREVKNTGELPVVGLRPSKRVVSIDTAVGLVPLLESRERLGVGARDPVDWSSGDVASGSKL